MRWAFAIGSMPREYSASRILCCRNIRPSSSCTGASGTGTRAAVMQALRQHARNSGRRSSARMWRGTVPLDRRYCWQVGGLRQSGNAHCEPRLVLQPSGASFRNGFMVMVESLKSERETLEHAKTGEAARSGLNGRVRRRGTLCNHHRHDHSKREDQSKSKPRHAEPRSRPVLRSLESARLGADKPARS